MNSTLSRQAYDGDSAAGIVRTVSRVMLLGVACLMVTLLCSQEAKAQLEVDITLDCEDSQVELDVSPGSGGSTTVTCSIENGALYEKTVALSLNITGTDVDGSLSDNQVVVAASTTEEVTLTFEAPIRTESNDYSVDLEATVTRIGMVPLNEQVQSTQSKSLEVSVLAFASLDYSATAFTLKGEPGDSFNISAKVRNTGNTQVNVDFFIKNNDEILAKGIDCKPEPTVNDLDLNGYIDQTAMQCTISSDYEKTEEVVIKMYARAKKAPDIEYISPDENVRVSVEVPSEGGFSSLTEDLSEEDLQLLMYAGGGLVVLLVVLIIMVKISRSRGGGGVDVWDDEEFDFEL